ncbi:MAG TPA: hypothetical protein VIR31_05940 [Nitrososphaeraceae archaeon]
MRRLRRHRRSTEEVYEEFLETDDAEVSESDSNFIPEFSDEARDLEQQFSFHAKRL